MITYVDYRFDIVNRSFSDSIVSHHVCEPGWIVQTVMDFMHVNGADPEQHTVAVISCIFNTSFI
jgi:hypothetical protein